MIRILMLSGGCICVLLFGAGNRPDPLLPLTWPWGLANAIERPYAGICVVDLPTGDKVGSRWIR